MTPPQVDAIYPLSPQQQGILFGTLAAPASGIYIEQEVHRFDGEVNGDAFERAWQLLVDRHAILRTAFAWREQEQPMQVVLHTLPVTVRREDWSHLPPSDQHARLSGYIAQERDVRFDVSKPPLMRLTLVRMSRFSHAFVWTQHHLVMDGWSRQVIARELVDAYGAYCANKTPRLPPAPSYGDYITWLRRQDLSAAEHFWKAALAGAVVPTPLGVPDLQSASPSTAEPWAMGELPMPRTTLQQLQTTAREWHVTLNTLLQGAWAMLLSHYSRLDDVVFGTTVSGRPTDLPGAEAIVGLLVNTLPFRVRVDALAPLTNWVTELQLAHSELRRFEYCSTGQIHQWSGLPASSPLHDSLLVFENYPSHAVNASASSHHSTDASGSSGARTTYPLTLLAFADQPLLVRAVYDNRRLQPADVTRLLAHMRTVLEALGRQPEGTVGDVLALLPADERPRIAPLQRTRPRQTTTRTAPSTPIEQTVAGIWREVLGAGDVDVQDNFFALGGHSLLAAQVMARLRATYQVELPLRLIFETPHIAGLAKAIEESLLRQIEQLSDEEVLRLLADEPNAEAS